jgi:hypothetical protein
VTWFKVDDGFPHHPKLARIVALHPDRPDVFAAAITVWTLMGADCALRRTDGVFDLTRARRVVELPAGWVEAGVGALVAVSLLEPRGGGAFAFHGWEEYQPTKSELEEERRAANERQKRWRKSQRAKRMAALDGSPPPPDPAEGVDALRETRDIRASRDGDSPPRQSPRSVAGSEAVGVDGAPSRPVPSQPERESAPSRPRLAAVERTGPAGDELAHTLAEASDGRIAGSASAQTLAELEQIARAAHPKPLTVRDMGLIGEAAREGKALAFIKDKRVTLARLTANGGKHLLDALEDARAWAESLGGAEGTHG